MALFYLLFQELGTQHVKAHCLVLKLRTLVLALYDNPCRKVRNTHGRGYLIDVLTACAARMVNIDTDIVVVNLYFVVILYLGHNFQGTKRGLSAFIRIKRRNTHKSVYAHFRLQIPVSVLALHTEVHTLKTSAVTCFSIQLVYLKAHLFAVTAVHTVEHLTPIASFRTACACVQSQHGVVVVVFAFQNRTDTHFFDILFRRVKHFVQLGNERFILRFLNQIHHVCGIGERRCALLVSGNLITDRRSFLTDFGGFFQILPNLRVFLLLFKLRKTRAQMLDIKSVFRLFERCAHRLNF